MRNESAIRLIEAACNEFEQGRIPIEELQLQIEGNGQAIEGISRQDYGRLHDYCNQLERIQFTCLLEKQYGEAIGVIHDLRQFLSEIDRRFSSHEAGWDTLRLTIASPPDRTRLVVEIFCGDAQWAEVNHESGSFEVAFYPRPDGEPWRIPFEQALSALEMARWKLQDRL